MKPVKIIGMGQALHDITPEQMKIIKDADLLIGGTKLLVNFDNLNVQKIEIKNNLALIVKTIQAKIDSNKIVVLASGDPLFFGIGTYLIKKIGKENVKIYPNISSAAKAFSKINESWHDAKLISLHGKRSKKFDNLTDLFADKTKFGILTDKKKDPVWIARKIIANNMTDFSMCVLEELDTNNEKIRWFHDLSKVAENQFAHPNIVILKRDHSSTDSAKNRQIFPGMADGYFLHEKGLITKAEIRSIAISKLNFVNEDHLFWDLGSGSGSISIEVSSILTKGKIYAVEKNLDRISLIKKNILKYNVKNINVIHANLPDNFDKLPVPDRIFIGGGGKDLAEITECAVDKLALNGVIVVNTILIQNLEPVFKILKKQRLNPQAISVQISKSKDMPFGTRFEALNPVWIIYGKKEY